MKKYVKLIGLLVLCLVFLSGTMALADEYPSIKHVDKLDMSGYEGAIEENMTLCVESYIGSERSGEGIKLPRFGSFRVQNRKARKGRNPATGETIEIAERKAVVFKPSRFLRDAIDKQTA